MKLKLYIFLSYFIILVGFAQVNTVTVYRSEFENANDEIFDLNDTNENNLTYTILSGNNDNYYAIDGTSGKVRIINPIPDTFNNVHTDNLVVAIGTTNYSLQIVDAYDYFLSNLPQGYSVLSNDGEFFIDNSSQWTAHNNLWGKGNAIENQDFRIAILKKNTFPNQTIILWDVPSEASTFNGNAVWCYSNLFWGNRKNVRENLNNFPFKINMLSSLSLDFDFEQLFGNYQYKVALNLFTTDIETLANFSENKGDFFFVFDQINNYLPPYPFSLPDITIEGKPFAVLYDNENNGEFYERRRVIIKNGLSVTQGTINLKSLFDMYSNAGYLNTNQFIPNIQVGLEITDGFGALRFNYLEFNTDLLSTNEFSNDAYVFYPNPLEDKLFWNENSTIEVKSITVYNSIGQKIIMTPESNYFDFSSLPKGIYWIKYDSKIEKIIKK